MLSQQYPVLDVRSPGEFTHAHIPGAYNLPLFTDEERKVVGTAYKQESRETAIKIGLDYFGVKMRKMVEEAERITGKGQWAMGNEQGAMSKRQEAMSKGQEAMSNEKLAMSKGQEAMGNEQGAMGNEQLAMGKGQEARGNGQEKNITNELGQLPIANCLLVYCWRGGMRSAGVAWLLDLYGFKVYTLIGGYKVYRHWVRTQFEKKYNFTILGGYTGTGKTLVIRELKRLGKAVVDLEGLANHKGSAFGALGEKPQPSQELFENLLAGQLSAVSQKIVASEEACSLSNDLAGAIYMEDESQRIGLLNIPNELWNTMRNSSLVFIDIPFEERLDYLTEEYGRFEKENLVNAIIRIQKRLGGLETKTAINHLLENNYKECFRVLLKYYDKCYGKALINREKILALFNKITCLSVDVKTITNTLINEKATI
ncbi:MAG: tRNA 2-selenouridine(34) synthase MnmH [Ferruginibacter sp.]